MGKNKVILRTCTIFMISVLLFSVLIIRYVQGDGRREWKKTLEEVFCRIVEDKILSDHLLLLEVFRNNHFVFFDASADKVIESEFPFSANMGILIPEKEKVEGMKKENDQKAEKEEEGEEIFLTEQGNFIPAREKAEEINWDETVTLEDIMKKFYNIDPTTEVTEEMFNIQELRKMDLKIEKGGDKPQILIYHTHSQEAFSDSEAGKKEDTIVGAGELLASILTEYGYRVMHHTGEYDVKSRDYAYSESLPAITRLLEENPEIEVVIDLHRDAVQEGTKLVTTLQDRETAKVMFFNGLCRSKEQGEITYLKNPYLKENLAFSLQMKVACDEYYPGFARDIYLRAYRYNMHLLPKTLLVELGAQTNTVEEIKNALYPLAHVLDIVLFGNEK